MRDCVIFIGLDDSVVGIGLAPELVGPFGESVAAVEGTALTGAEPRALHTPIYVTAEERSWFAVYVKSA